MAKWFALLVLALAVVHTTARNAPAPNDAGLNDQKNFGSFGGVGGYSGVGDNGLPFGGVGAGGGIGGGLSGGLGGGIGGAAGIGTLPTGGLGGLGGAGGLGGIGGGAGGGIGSGTGIIPIH
ncbi:hypothetical protein UlMin_031802 [Ulmus minor]